MKDCKVRKLIYEAVKSWSTELEAVEIYGGDCSCGEIVRWVITVEAHVVAYVPANPGFGDA